jgi:hypothetical protein
MSKLFELQSRGRKKTFYLHGACNIFNGASWRFKRWKKTLILVIIKFYYLKIILCFYVWTQKSPKSQNYLLRGYKTMSFRNLKFCYNYSKFLLRIFKCKGSSRGCNWTDIFSRQLGIYRRFGFKISEVFSGIFWNFPES